MRQILIDRARSKRRLKRGGKAIRVNLDEIDLAMDAEPEPLLLVDEALELLAREDPNKVELVKLRFYAGLSVEESAQALGISEKTVQRHWIHARAWLFREIQRLASSQ
jgi:RNA polymerase sigma factor (TIGR02999 family)